MSNKKVPGHPSWCALDKPHDGECEPLAVLAALPGTAPDWIDEVIQRVAELPDRTSPGDWPEAMLVTADELRVILDAPHRGTPDRAPGTAEFETLLDAARRMDWRQVVGNGGPPCFNLERPGKFCGRAERWAGHDAGTDHRFVSLEDLVLDAFHRGQTGLREARMHVASAFETLTYEEENEKGGPTLKPRTGLDSDQIAFAAEALAHAQDELARVAHLGTPAPLRKAVQRLDTALDVYMTETHTSHDREEVFAARLALRAALSAPQQEGDKT